MKATLTAIRQSVRDRSHRAAAAFKSHILRRPENLTVTPAAAAAVVGGASESAQPNTTEINSPHDPQPQQESRKGVDETVDGRTLAPCLVERRPQIGIPIFPSNSALLNLPAELRMQIWEYLTDGAEDQWPFFRELIPLKEGTTSGPSSAPARLQFLLTCRRMYHDAWAIAFPKMVFHFHKKAPGEENLSMQDILTRRAARLPPEKRDIVRRLSITTFMFKREETERHRPTQRFSLRAVGLRSVHSLTVWKLAGENYQYWEAHWFAHQVLKWVDTIGSSVTECELKIYPFWKFAADGLVGKEEGYPYEGEKHFAHSVRRAMNSVTLTMGMRERVAFADFKDWDRKTRRIEYVIRSTGTGAVAPTRRLRALVMCGQDAVNMGIL